jgi:hypothetical protein
VVVQRLRSDCKPWRSDEEDESRNKWKDQKNETYRQHVLAVKSNGTSQSLHSIFSSPGAKSLFPLPALLFPFPLLLPLLLLLPSLPSAFPSTSSFVSVLNLLRRGLSFPVALRVSVKVFLQAWRGEVVMGK